VIVTGTFPPLGIGDWNIYIVFFFFLIKQRLLEYVLESTLSVFILQNNFIKHVTFCFFKIVKYSNFREDIVSTPILFFND